MGIHKIGFVQGLQKLKDVCRKTIHPAAIDRGFTALARAFPRRGCPGEHNLPSYTFSFIMISGYSHGVPLVWNVPVAR
jgi:hypothetical protein